MIGASRLYYAVGSQRQPHIAFSWSRFPFDVSSRRGFFYEVRLAVLSNELVVTVLLRTLGF